MERTKKQTKNTIAKVWEGIEIHFKRNPVPIPNRTLLRWVEEYCPYSFGKIYTIIQKSSAYDTSKDIYHQEFSLIILTVNQYLENNGFNARYSFMSRKMQEALLSIENQLKPIPFTRKK